MKTWIKTKIREQFLDTSRVVPFQRWSDAEGCFYINSSEGLIRYKPKNQKDAARFRDKWINDFESIISQEDSGYFLRRFYKEIRKSEKIKYKANLRTRLRVRFAF